MGNSSGKFDIKNGSGNFSRPNDKPIKSKHNKLYPEYLVKLGQVLQKKSLDDNGGTGNGITKFIFKKYLSNASDSVAIALFDYFLIKEGILIIDDSKQETVESSNDKVLHQEQFARQASILLNCVNETKQLEYYIKVFARGKDEITNANFVKLVEASYQIAQFAHCSAGISEDLLAALSKTIMLGKDRMPCQDVINWCCETCPRLVMWLHRYLCYILTIGYSAILTNEEHKEQHEYEYPVVDSANKILTSALHPSLLWILSCSLPSSYTRLWSTPESLTYEGHSANIHQFPEHMISGQTPSHWIALFNSNDHGMSINRFKHHVFDYQGPTLLFVTTEDKSVFCIACDEPWKESNHFYGSYESMCMQLLPEYKVIERGQNLVYFSIKGYPSGFQIGTDQKSRILTIDLNLENVEYKRFPTKLKALEVWGCGASNAKTNQQETKKLATQDAVKASKVKLDVNGWKDSPDRMLLEMSGTRPTYAKFEKETQQQT